MVAAINIEEQAADWIALRGSDRWSPALQQHLDAWLDLSTGHRVAYLRLATAWALADRLRALKAQDDPVAMPPPAAAVPHRRQRAQWRAAAALLLAVGLLGAAAERYLGEDGTVHEVSIGQRENFKLADGTRVALNTASRLRTSVDERSRSAWLDRGEAYFDVAHDASRPFVVHAGKHDVTVLGTRFTVLRDGDRLVLSVLEGRVRLDWKGTADAAAPTVVSRNDVVLASSGRVLTTHRTDAEMAAALSWRQGRLSFDQTTLAQAAAEFNRYNRKKLVIDDPAAAGTKIGGAFAVDNIEGFARLLRDGFGLTVREQGDVIRVGT